MRRIALALIPLALLLTGCLGRDAGHAQALLQQAEAAQEHVSSEGLVMRLKMEYEGKSIGIAMQGGMYTKGPRAGDFYLTATSSGDAELSGFDFQILRRGGQVTLRMDGRTQTMSVTDAQAQLGSGIADATQFLDIARYVKSVSVSEADVDGRPADKIVGTLDTKDLLEGVAGLGTQMLGGSGLDLGDIRAVLFVPRDTHLVESMFVDMEMKVAGHTTRMHLSLAVNNVNKPVAFPDA